jgi:hypothetical protein
MNNEFRNRLLDCLNHKGTLAIAFEEDKKLSSYIYVDENNCKVYHLYNIAGTYKGSTLTFNRRQWMLKLAGPDKVKDVNKSKEAVHSALKKIEDVLGDVPAAEELRSAVKKLMVSVDSVLS